MDLDTSAALLLKDSDRKGGEIAKRQAVNNEEDEQETERRREEEERESEWDKYMKAKVQTWQESRKHCSMQDKLYFRENLYFSHSNKMPD